ncbi:MAG: HD domain-containing phosphohydrolase [Roseibium sp.]
MFIRIFDSEAGLDINLPSIYRNINFENRSLKQEFEHLSKELPLLVLFEVVSEDPKIRAKVKVIVKSLETTPIVAVFDHNLADEISFWSSLGVHDTVHKTSEQDGLLTQISNCDQEYARNFALNDETAPERTLAVAERALEDMSAAMLDKQELSTSSTTAAATFINALLEQGREREWLHLVGQHHSPTLQHSLEVANIMYRFATTLGIENDEKLLLTKMSLVHDIGKLQIPLSILDKPEKLTDSEIELIKQHPETGADFLREFDSFPDKILCGVRSHHEYLDGSGYPDGLSAEEIPQFVRMLTIADIFAALTEKRAYKSPYSPRVAVTILWDMKRKLDTKLLPIFNREFASSEFGKVAGSGKRR